MTTIDRCLESTLMTTSKILGPCPLCGRDMVEGVSVDRHHLVPRSEGGKFTKPELCHVVCHRKIHSTFSEPELNTYYHTWSRLKQHEQIRRFIKWVAKKDVEYVDVHRDTNSRNRQRRK